MNKKVALIIMDGWGHGPHNNQNAIYNAQTPFINSLYNQYPHAELLTCGEHVGLPDGQMGNSEVGHLNLGAGRIVYQELGRIHKAIKERTLHQHPVLIEAIRQAKSKHKKVHLIGLVSDGGVHSHINHLMALCDICKEQGQEEVYIHAFMDGRDTDPRSGLGYIQTLEEHLRNSVGKIATVCGRYYAMDRDKRWERIKLAYDLLVTGIGSPYSNATQAIMESYQRDVTDEFITPVVINNEQNLPLATISEGDTVICFNFRTDRCREITEVLTQKDFPDFDMHTIPLYYVTMTSYDANYQDVHVIYDKDDLNNTLGEVLAQHHKTQIRIAETEKYPHVSFFFSGGRETPFVGENRIMIPSPKVATYDLQPEMSAYGITEAIVAEINNQSADFICLNFANTDMVGHTGVFSAIVKAAETVDKCVQSVVQAAMNNGYTVILTADHGNADYAINEDGSPNTAHTLNPVPWFLIDKDFKPTIQSGVLADVAPTVLQLMGVPQPSDMTGRVLF